MTPSRPVSSLSQHSVASTMSSSVHAAFKPRATPRRPRPYSIAVTGISGSTTPDSASARHSELIYLPESIALHPPSSPSLTTNQPIWLKKHYCIIFKCFKFVFILFLNLFLISCLFNPKAISYNLQLCVRTIVPVFKKR